MITQQPFTFKIFFQYFPKGVWMGIIGALALRILVPASDRLPFMIVNILLVVICTKVMVIIHEAGHLLTASWAGATPKRMVLGTGYEIYRTEFKGVKIIFNSIPLGCEAAAVFGDVSHLRWRNAFYIVGENTTKIIFRRLITTRANSTMTRAKSVNLFCTIYQMNFRFDEALQLFKNLEVRANTKEHQGYKGIIYNNIAFTYLLRNEPAEALQYANVAVNLLKNEPNVIGTYAATLIENGDDNGIAWMMNEIDTDHPNDHTIMASAYVALGYHLKGDYKSRDKYLKFVHDNQDRLDNDTRFLVERNLERMNGR